MELTVQHVGDVRFEIAVRGHRLICDQPVENAGADAGMSPPEFLLASLGTCAGYYAVQYLKTRGLPLDGVSVRVSAAKELKPARMENFRIQVITPPLDERHREGVLRAVKQCLVHNTLLNPPVIETVVEAPALVLDHS